MVEEIDEQNVPTLVGSRMDDNKGNTYLAAGKVTNATSKRPLLRLQRENLWRNIGAFQPRLS